MQITKEFVFACAHKLDNYEGPCKMLHGHTYKLQVTLQGEPKNNGMLMDFVELKNIVTVHVISKLDHRYLNEIAGLAQPTAENLVIWIWNILRPVFGNMLYKLKLWETPTSFVTYAGENSKF